MQSKLVSFSMVLASGLMAVPAICGTDPEATQADGGQGAAGAKSSGPGSNWEKNPSAWKVAIYPIYGWIPVFGASVNLPNFPNPPNAPVASSGKVSGSFNGAGFAAFDIEKSRVTVNGSFLYASISGDNTNPNVDLGLDIMYGEVLVGYKIAQSLDLEGGVRRMALKIDATVGSRPTVSRKPGVWDPLIGMTWKHQMGRKWMLRTHLDGGGFGVGSDVSLAGSVRADWRFAKHFGVAMGFAGLHFQIADTALDQTRLERTVKIKQTLYGPLVGFGIYF